MIPALNNFFSAQPLQRQHVEKATLAFKTAAIVAMAATAVFGCFSITSLIALAPIRAATYLGCGFISLMTYDLATDLANHTSEVNDNTTDGRNLLGKAIATNSFFSTILSLITPAHNPRSHVAGMTCASAHIHIGAHRTATGDIASSSHY